MVKVTPITRLSFKVLGYLLHLQGNPNPEPKPGPSTTEWLSNISEGQFFEVAAPVCKTAFQMVESWHEDVRNGNVDAEEAPIFPDQAKSPGPIVFLSLETLPDCLVALLTNETDRVSVYALGVGFPPRLVGNFIAGGNSFRSEDVAVDGITALLSVVAMLLVLINEPRWTTRIGAASRQERRHLARTGKFPPHCWHRIEWKIDEDQAPKAKEGAGGWKNAFHIRRGHFRKAGEGFTRAQWLDASVVTDRPAGWYQWIESMPVGDPRYGIRRSVHAPTLSSLFQLKKKVL